MLTPVPGLCCHSLFLCFRFSFLDPFCFRLSFLFFLLSFLLSAILLPSHSLPCVLPSLVSSPLPCFPSSLFPYSLFPCAFPCVSLLSVFPSFPCAFFFGSSIHPSIHYKHNQTNTTTYNQHNTTITSANKRVQPQQTQPNAIH